MKASIFSKYDNSTDQKHAEFYLNYYRKIQIIDVIRALSVIAIIFVIITFKSGSSFSFLAVGLGALIITLKDFILSILAFFFVLRQYHIGDTIGVGDIQGQIIYIRIFSIGILGKDNDGDSTGRMFVIPGHKLITESIRKEDLHANSIRKELIKIPYKTQDFTLEFQDFIKSLEKYLREILTTLSKKNCGNFQTYIGHKYKLDIDYFEDKCIIVTVGIVGKWEDNVENKIRIVNFIESFRREKQDREEE
jgi:small-conductance mechanosensitive channel